MTAPAETPQEPSERALLARIVRTYLAPRWKTLAWALFCAVLVAALTALLAWLLNPAIKRIFIQKRTDSLVLIPLVIAGVAILRGAAQVGVARAVNRMGHRMVADIQMELFGKLIRADLARLRANHSGAHVASVLYDAGLIREAATSGVVNYVQNGLIVIFSVGVMLSQDPWLSLIVLVAGPAASAIMRRFSKRSRKAAVGAMVETSALSTAVMESLDGVKVVKIDNREAFEEGRVAAVIGRRQRHIIKGADARATAAPATETLMTLITAAVIGYAGWRATSGQMTLGQLMAFLVALGAASQSLRQVANLQTVMAEGSTAARRLFAALDVRAEIRDAPTAKALALTEASVVFEKVSFAYAPGAPALTEVSLEARPGESVALVGPSGGGKSTLLNLIPRFYDVDAGQVRVGGVDIRDVTLASLRSRIALVTQEPFLFDDTIRANIAYARPEADFAEVEAAARAAAAHDFVEAMAKGYDTVVGEAGARLSGGQRQRIAIARAFLKNAPILLLDEATSALDAESEAQVQQALERLMTGRTTFVIAHRLATVRHCDRIYVIDQGRVVETGDHASLMAAKGLYARLARSQHLDLAAAEPTDAVS
ncbi:MAG: ABC transporter ATP-binding protein [Caulobacteraceae bacterium]